MSISYDLHCHSNQSDGILSPEALVSRAKAQNVQVLALTDHDTVCGLSRARIQAGIEDLTLINGIEFSSQWHDKGVHIVGLNIDVSGADIVAAIDRQEGRRRQRAEIIAQRLDKLGLSGTLDGAKKHAGEGVVGRPHFAQYLVERGHCRSVDQAFKKYLGAGKPGDVKQIWPDFDEVIGAIRAAGGVAVLAHPLKYKLTRSKLCALLEDFVAAGGQAMEVVSGVQQPKVTEDLARIANKFGLMASCGSDFHQPGGGWQELGRCSPLPETVTPVWRLWE